MTADTEGAFREMHDELESLFVNNLDLDLLRAHLGRFNPIKTMGMEHMEIRHSAILAWLLNPQETHGLGDGFLKAFLAEALRGRREPEGLSALDVSQADLMGAEVRREWRKIDILVLSQQNGWVFVIENKFNSRQHSDQLRRYYEIAKATFLTKESFERIAGIFLTLEDDEPEDRRYASIRYSDVCELVERYVFSGHHPMTGEVDTFLKHYLEIIREATGMSEKQSQMEGLARQLYRDHRRVLDFIIQYGKATDFRMACEALIGGDPESTEYFTIDDASFVLGGVTSNDIWFLPLSWYEALGEDRFYWHGCEPWWMEYPVVIWMRLVPQNEGTKGKVWLYGEVGPLKDHNFRKELIGAIADKASAVGLSRIKFQSGATEENRRYSRFFRQNGFLVDDVHDHEDIAKNIRRALKAFRKEIAAVGEILPQFQKYGKSEPSQ